MTIFIWILNNQTNRSISTVELICMIKNIWTICHALNGRRVIKELWTFIQFEILEHLKELDASIKYISSRLWSKRHRIRSKLSNISWTGMYQLVYIGKDLYILLWPRTDNRTYRSILVNIFHYLFWWYQATRHTIRYTSMILD